jgi:hypothetical protein
MVAINLNPSFQYGTRKNIYKSALASLYNKKKLWNQLKSERELRQKNESLENNKFRLYKKVYTIDNIKYYKVLGLDSDYYIKIDSLSYTASSKFAIQLCYYTINGMKCKKALLKINSSRDKMYISENSQNLLFKECKFENKS